VLGPAPGSTDVMIGNMPAWRGVGAAAAADILEAKKASEKAIKAAEDETEAATTDKEEAAKEKEDTLKDAEALAMGSMIAGAAGLADQHVCTTVLPIPPHGAGVVVDGSQTVLINDLPACREGDTIVEPIGPPNLISKGESTVIIGG
jgi:uncharacterized Zn-binding protein involved in type VI secretion